MNDKKKKPGRPKQEAILDTKLETRCSKAEKELWTQAAELSKQSASGWAREVLNKAAKKVVKKSAQS